MSTSLACPPSSPGGCDDDPDDAEDSFTSMPPPDLPPEFMARKRRKKTVKTPPGSRRRAGVDSSAPVSQGEGSADPSSDPPSPPTSSSTAPPTCPISTGASSALPPGKPPTDADSTSSGGGEDDLFSSFISEIDAIELQGGYTATAEPSSSGASFAAASSSSSSSAPPVDLSAYWKEVLDPVTQKSYYWNLLSGLVSWEKPPDSCGEAAAPPGAVSDPFRSSARAHAGHEGRGDGGAMAATSASSFTSLASSDTTAQPLSTPSAPTPPSPRGRRPGVYTPRSTIHFTGAEAKVSEFLHQIDWLEKTCDEELVAVRSDRQPFSSSSLSSSAVAASDSCLLDVSDTTWSGSSSPGSASNSPTSSDGAEDESGDRRSRAGLARLGVSSLRVGRSGGRQEGEKDVKKEAWRLVDVDAPTAVGESSSASSSSSSSSAHVSLDEEGEVACGRLVGVDDALRQARARRLQAVLALRRPAASAVSRSSAAPSPAGAAAGGGTKDTTAFSEDQFFQDVLELELQDLHTPTQPLSSGALGDASSAGEGSSTAVSYGVTRSGTAAQQAQIHSLLILVWDRLRSVTPTLRVYLEPWQSKTETVLTTRTSDWAAGALSARYFLLKLQEATKEIEREVAKGLATFQQRHPEGQDAALAGQHAEELPADLGPSEAAVGVVVGAAEEGIGERRAVGAQTGHPALEAAGAPAALLAGESPPPPDETPPPLPPSPESEPPPALPPGEEGGVGQGERKKKTGRTAAAAAAAQAAAGAVCAGTAAGVSLRHRKVQRQLVNRWKRSAAMAEEEAAATEAAAETAEETRRNKKEKEIEEWKEKQIAQGRSKHNANFIEVSNNWKNIINSKIDQTQPSQQE
eukprot:GHVT01075044.1.p1 GENE.GHVT01075044.1~~GHVT01075044.1.p1  ORF type:complete len:858 (-),score=259.57 GHVT01075044.1:239-2812(-)